MENASKALLIAAEVLFGVMLLVLIVTLTLVFKDMGNEYNERINLNEVQKFNENFLKYENRKDGLTAQDLVTIYNFVQQYNKSIDYDDAQIVKIDGSITILGIGTFSFSGKDVNTNDFLEKYSYDESNKDYYKYKIQITSKSEITGKVNGIKFQKT